MNIAHESILRFQENIIGLVKTILIILKGVFIILIIIRPDYFDLYPLGFLNTG
jgi:hypothetical protein